MSVSSIKQTRSKRPGFLSPKFTQTSLFFIFQFDFVELLDGRRLLTQEARSLEGPQRQHRAFVPLSSHETGFIQYLDSGIWHLAFYNDGKESEVVSFLTTAIGKDFLFYSSAGCLEARY